VLHLLLDEHLSKVVARGLTSRRPDIRIVTLFEWRNGALVGQPDPVLLQAAAEDGLTLVSRDVNTIPQLLAEWHISGQSHAGVIFVHSRTIRSADLGGLIRSVEWLWDREQGTDWTDRIEFLRRV
jgi:hypothetical protein